MSVQLNFIFMYAVDFEVKLNWSFWYKLYLSSVLSVLRRMSRQSAKKIMFQSATLFFKFNYNDHHYLALVLDDGSNLRKTPCSFELGTNL
jgi:hypothetical protein